jgi:hypothetical protein
VNSNSAPIAKNKNQLIELFSLGNGILRLKLKNQGMGEIILYSLEGKQLFNQKITDDKTELCTPFDGILLYRFVPEKGEVQSGKVVVW